MPQDTAQTRKKEKSLFGNNPSLTGDDRSFAEQMQDLGVEVIKRSKKTEVVWYHLDFRRSGKLPNGYISLTMAGILLTEKTLEKLGGGPRIAVGIAKIDDKIHMILRADENGFKVSITKKGSCVLGTKKMTIWLEKQGIEKDWYKLKEIRGGWLAVPEGGGAGD